MINRIVWLAPLVVVSALAMPAHGQTEKPPFAFQSGQAIYVVSITTDGKADFRAESEVTNAFQKKKTFKLADSLAVADFVFVLVGEYTREFTDSDRRNSEVVMTTAMGIALTPGSYRQHKGDLEALRGAALWKELFTTGGWSGLTIINGRSTLPKKVVNKFHDAVVLKKK
jgi:hypothetical protein